MPPTFIKVRHRKTGAPAEISPNALRHFPEYEVVTDETPAAPAPAEQPQPSKTTSRRASAATEKE